MRTILITLALIVSLGKHVRADSENVCINNRLSNGVCTKTITICQISLSNKSAYHDDAGDNPHPSS